MQKIQNHAYHSFCLSMMQKILFLKKHAYLFITKSPFSFQNTLAMIAGLSDFHKMVNTFLKLPLT